nr:hypothetical protein P5630_10250 [Bacillus subtilis]
MEVQDDNFLEVDFVIRRFQETMMKIKYSAKPVVAAPFGMTLGGGTEVCLPAARIQAASEAYMGLVESGVGTHPWRRGKQRAVHQSSSPRYLDPMNAAMKTFETIAMAKVSASAQEAREMNILKETDQISVNQDHLLYDAKRLYRISIRYRLAVRL